MKCESIGYIVDFHFILVVGKRKPIMSKVVPLSFFRLFCYLLINLCLKVILRSFNVCSELIFSSVRKINLIE